MNLYGEIEGYDLEPCPCCDTPVKMNYYEEHEPVSFFACGYEVRCPSCGTARGEGVPVLPECDPRKAVLAQEGVAHKWNEFCKTRRNRKI